MSFHDISIASLDGAPGSVRDLTGGRPTLVVNVASRCGLTPQYAKLEQLQRDYADRGLTVLGVPCNQFGGQEPGTSEEIAEFCSASYGVTFPLTEKVEVKGANRHPLYDALTVTADQAGRGGDVQWNFEKFLVDRDGNVVARFSPQVEPDDPRLIEQVEALVA